MGCTACCARGWKIYGCIAIGSTTLATILLLLSVFLDRWETIEYMKPLLLQLAEQNLTLSVAFPNHTDTYFEFYNSTDEKVAVYVAMTMEGGMWKTCDTIPDVIRANIQQGLITKQCEDHTVVYRLEEDIATSLYWTNEPFRSYFNFTRSAQSCAIVAMIVQSCAWLFGIISVLGKQVMLGIIVAFCAAATAVYELFGTLLVTLRVNHIPNIPVEGVPEVILQTRKIESSASLPLSVTVIVLNVICVFVWLLFAIGLRDKMTNSHSKYNTKQICAMCLSDT